MPELAKDRNKGSVRQNSLCILNINIEADDKTGKMWPFRKTKNNYVINGGNPMKKYSSIL